MAVAWAAFVSLDVPVDAGAGAGVLVLGLLLLALVVLLALAGAVWWDSTADQRRRAQIAVEQAKAEAKLQLMTLATIGRLIAAARQSQQQSSVDLWTIHREEP